MALIGVQNLTISFGGPPLLDGIDLQIEEGDRLCLLGRNGAGKSTFMKALAALIPSDGGKIARRKGLSTAYLSQDFPDDFSGLALEFVTGGVAERRLAAEQSLSLLGVAAEEHVSSLSGGQKRRVLLAQVLAAGADLLLLDEPTNHLDIDTILKLEDFLLRRVKSVVFVTHDRSFARQLANRVAEIDRGKLYSFSCSYDEFLSRRDELLEAERRAWEVFDKKLAEEEEWLRRGIRARRTRNEGRVKALMQMRDAYRQRRERSGHARMEIHKGERSGDIVIKTKGLTFGYDSALPIVKDFSTVIERGDRVGIVGPNGSGKTTLLRLLLGQLEPLNGSVRLGTNVTPLFFDQLRSDLDPNKTVVENVADGFDTVTLNGRKRHIIGYLRDFLFSEERAKSPVAHLSGGERNRLLLARLFARPSNLLIFDEPTNDLDVDTLELLEELLQEYEGTLLLVSHDRSFLDNVVTDCLVFTGEGQIAELAGGYADWANSPLFDSVREGGDDKVQEPKGEKPKTRDKVKLTFKQHRELEALPDAISALEEEQETIHNRLSDPELYKNGDEDPSLLAKRLEELDGELATAYQRWEELDAIDQAERV
ncbi:ATP-binding cassette domain-containing protein [Sediminispirochaeta smaragdinae]|nr:ATP-binding cassette domain-containing protein [Sediminispirochaeta smaragdinae]